VVIVGGSCGDLVARRTREGLCTQGRRDGRTRWAIVEHWLCGRGLRRRGWLSVIIRCLGLLDHKGGVRAPAGFPECLHEENLAPSTEGP